MGWKVALAISATVLIAAANIAAAQEVKPQNPDLIGCRGVTEVGLSYKHAPDGARLHEFDQPVLDAMIKAGECFQLKGVPLRSTHWDRLGVSQVLAILPQGPVKLWALQQDLFGSVVPLEDMDMNECPTPDCKS
jgi:hypothetical protein